MTVLVFDAVAGHPGADAIEVSDGTIAAVGIASTLAPTGAVSQVGGIALPGLRDAHLHPLEVAAAGSRLDLGWARSFEDIRHAVRRRAGSLRLAEPLVATGLDDERLAEGAMPTRHDLDAILSARPILVFRHCSHIASANTLALELAGLMADPVDPVGGHIRRDADGSPDGVLEESAIGSVSTVLAADVAAPDPESISATLMALRANGLVAVDAMVSTGRSMWCSGGDEIGTLLRLGDLPITVDVHVIAASPEELTTAARRLADGPDRLRFAGWKGFADGSLGGRTAALRADYADAPGRRGMPRTPESELRAMAECAADLGGTAAIHAIGDAAVDVALSVARGLDRGHVRIEHASVADPDQVASMAALGVVASVQPSFVTSDAAWLGTRLGPERSAWAYPFRTMLDAGVAVVGGSDGPIEDPDPLVGIADATADREQALSVDEAIRMYANAPLDPGSAADIVVVDREPAAGTRAAVTAMWMGGRRIR